MQSVGEHEVPVGPLAVRWRAWQLLRPARAGTATEVDLVFENAGSVEWRTIEVSYHWLDDRGNAIVWGEIWTPLSRSVKPGGTIEQRIELRAPPRAGPHRLPVDLLGEGRCLFSQDARPRLEGDRAVHPTSKPRLA